MANKKQKLGSSRVWHLEETFRPAKNEAVLPVAFSIQRSAFSQKQVDSGRADLLVCPILTGPSGCSRLIITPAQNEPNFRETPDGLRSSCPIRSKLCRRNEANFDSIVFSIQP
jgi:hypothetical protein